VGKGGPELQSGSPLPPQIK